MPEALTEAQIRKNKALQKAIFEGDVSEAERALNKGADPNLTLDHRKLEMPGSSHATLLHWLASRHKNNWSEQGMIARRALMKLLIDHGADPCRTALIDHTHHYTPAQVSARHLHWGDLEFWHRRFPQVLNANGGIALSLCWERVLFEPFNLSNRHPIDEISWLEWAETHGVRLDGVDPTNGAGVMSVVAQALNTRHDFRFAEDHVDLASFIRTNVEHARRLGMSSLSLQRRRGTDWGSTLSVCSGLEWAVNRMQKNHTFTGAASPTATAWVDTLIAWGDEDAIDAEKAQRRDVILVLALIHMLFRRKDSEADWHPGEIALVKRVQQDPTLLKRTMIDSGEHSGHQEPVLHIMLRCIKNTPQLKLDKIDFFRTWANGAQRLIEMGADLDATDTLGRHAWETFSLPADVKAWLETQVLSRNRNTLPQHQPSRLPRL